MKKYDAVVIGAGTGGLSAALSLAVAGKKTLLIEKHNVPGGCGTSIVRGRFEFDLSLHEYCGIGEPGNWGPAGKLLNEKYGLKVQWLPAPEMYRCVSVTRSGKRIDMTMPTGIENCIHAIEEAVPGSEASIRKFFALAQECREASEYFDEHLDKYTKDDFVKVDDLYFMTHFPNFLKVAEKPFTTVMREIGVPEDAIDIMSPYWLYLSDDLDHMSFVMYAWMFLMYCDLKPSTCRYKSFGITAEFVKRFEELGGEVWLNTKANRVVANDEGRIIGVDTTEGFVETNYVIANLNPYFAYTQLLDKKIDLPMREVKRVNASKPAVSFVNVYLGLNKSPEELGIHDYSMFVPPAYDSAKCKELAGTWEGNTNATFVCYNLADPKASPEGTTTMTFTIPVTEPYWGAVNDREYTKKKEEAFGMVLDAFEKQTGIKIRDSIEEIEIATPWTFANYLNTPNGVIYGYELNDWDTMISRMIAMKKDQPIRGVKTVGAAGARGDGYSQTHLNGNDMAQLVLQEMAEEEEK